MYSECRPLRHGRPRLDHLPVPAPRNSHRPVPKVIEYGAMLEVPSLAETLDILLPKVDFLPKAVASVRMGFGVNNWLPAYSNEDAFERQVKMGDARFAIASRAAPRPLAAT